MPGFALVLESFNVLDPKFVPIFGKNDFVGLFEMNPQRESIIVERERSHCVEACFFVGKEGSDVLFQVEKVQAHGVFRSRSCLA